MKRLPPQWPKRFLQWFCDPDLLEFIQGDLEELYGRRVSKKGHMYANLAFCWEVMRFFRPSNFRIPTKFHQTMMLKNYLLIGMRNLRKNWANSFINISGLTLSVGCAITTFLFADFFFHLNSIHPHLDRLYQVVSHVEEQDRDVLYGPAATIIAERLQEDIPEIRAATRVQYLNGNFKFGSKVFRERVQFTDPSFFDLFDFPLLAGGKRDFENNELFISSAVATKYFGEEDPIGQRVAIKFGEEKLTLKVGGVFGQVPANTTFKPAILLNYDLYQRISHTRTNWIDEARATFVLLEDQVDPDLVSSRMQAYVGMQNAANPEQAVLSFELVSFTELTRRSDIGDQIVHGNDQSGTIGIAVIGLLLIVFACLNYVNIAIASAATRLREIGVRKVMGSSRLGIAQQFLVENFLVCAFAMVLGVAASYLILLPAFNTLIPITIPFAFSSLSIALICLIGLFIFLGLLSGSYPAFYISRFQTLQIFKGENQLKGRHYLSKVLLTGQFTLVFVTIMGCLVFTDNARFVKQLSWGYEPQGILSMPIAERAQLEEMQRIATANPQILSVASSHGHLGVDNSLVHYTYLGQSLKALRYSVNGDYMNLMGLPLLEGRYLSDADDPRSVVVNELFVEQMQWTDAVGHSFELEGRPRTVVGVVANVYHVFFDDDSQRPMVFTAGDLRPNFLVVKASPAHLVAVHDYLRGQWQEVAPFDPYVSYFQADSFNRSFENVDSNIRLMSALSAFTIFLSCLGLHGLLAFTMQNRLKEFGIRKVLGASGKTIMLLANREYAWIMVISFGLGAPLGVLLMQQFVSSFFAVSKPLGPSPVLIGLAVTIGTILISVMGQIRKVMHVNPAEVLKSE